MFERKNLYVLNKKDKTAIVYEDADGKAIRLTRDQFSSEEEFRRFKEWSDENYHETEKERHLYSDNTLSLDGLSDEAAAVCSVEDVIFERQRLEEREALGRLLMSGMDTSLTEVQRRRLWLYVVDGLSEAEIAAAEGVTQPSVSECIAAAKKRLKKFLKNTL